MSLNPENESYPHVSIFLSEMIELFQQTKLTCFVDATVGAGGHSEAILKAHPEIELWIGIDQDPDALELSKKRLLPLLKGKQAHFIHSRFADCTKKVAAIDGFSGCDGLFFDLGVSSMQLDQAERGFSLRHDGPLDMRMDPFQTTSAEEIVNRWPAKELEAIFRSYGEEPKARLASQMILAARQKKRITTTLELVQALDGLWKGSHKHPATRIFQALRIAVNEELKQVETALPLWMQLMNPKARLGVISFHSLEDRLVKLVMREMAKKEKWHLITPKPLEPSPKEMRQNPRSRSAKLRFIERPGQTLEDTPCTC